MSCKTDNYQLPMATLSSKLINNGKEIKEKVSFDEEIIYCLLQNISFATLELNAACFETIQKLSKYLTKCYSYVCYPNVTHMLPKSHPHITNMLLICYPNITHLLPKFKSNVTHLL